MEDCFIGKYLILCPFVTVGFQGHLPDFHAVYVDFHTCWANHVDLEVLLFPEVRFAIKYVLVDDQIRDLISRHTGFIDGKLVPTSVASFVIHPQVITSFVEKDVTIIDIAKPKQNEKEKKDIL